MAIVILQFNNSYVCGNIGPKFHLLTKTKTPLARLMQKAAKPGKVPPLGNSQNSQAVLAQLEKIVVHPLFAVAPSLVRFLRYVVEETLAGRSHTLKEYSIGSGVFGRGEDYSPRIDPIVRVQARNLRARLERYYAGPGVGDRVRIELPKGTYVPLFHERPHQWRAPSRLVSAVLAAVAALLLIGVAVMELHRAQHHEPAKARPFLAP